MVYVYYWIINKIYRYNSVQWVRFHCIALHCISFELNASGFKLIYCTFVSHWADITFSITFQQLCTMCGQFQLENFHEFYILFHICMVKYLSSFSWKTRWCIYVGGINLYICLFCVSISEWKQYILIELELQNGFNTCM